MIGYRTIGAILFFVGGMACAAPSQAQMITASNPQSVAAYLRSEGLTVTLKKDTDGDPLIESSLGKNQGFSVYFYNCTDHAACQTLQFYAGFTDSKADAARLNEWNRGKRFGRAYIDKVGDPVVEMDIDLNDPGMARALFADNFRLWKILMTEFPAFIYPE
jgi:hypothetical protein